MHKLASTSEVFDPSIAESFQRIALVGASEQHCDSAVSSVDSPCSIHCCGTCPLYYAMPPTIWVFRSILAITKATAYTSQIPPSHRGDLSPCPRPLPKPCMCCRGHFHSHRQPGDVQLHQKMDKERMGKACSTRCPERRYREGCSTDCHAHRRHDPHPHTGLSLLCPSVAFRDAAYMPLEIAGKDCLQATTFVCL